MATPQVAVIGRNCVDYISVVDQFPDEDKKTPLRVCLFGITHAQLSPQGEEKRDISNTR
jgi:hypothetical protein